MKQFTTTKAMMYMVLMMLAVFGYQEAKACNTNSNMYFTKVNNAGKYNFWAWNNSTGKYYKLNMRVTWDFGDGNSGSGQTSHTYVNQGKYNITLYLWDTSKNCGDTLRSSVCYFHPQVTAVTTRSNDTVLASATCNSNWKYYWIFDDNTYYYGSSCSVKHKYAKPDFYKPVLAMVRDTVMGCEDTIIYNFNILDFTRCGFHTDFSFNSGTGKINERTVVAEPFGKYNSSGKPGKVVWKWGDDSTTTIQSIPNFEYLTHLYGKAGTYTICHVVTDSAGTCKDSSCISTIVDSCAAQGDFTYTINGHRIYFNAKATTGSYYWEFAGAVFASGNQSAQVYAEYSGPGTYITCLQNTLNGCTKKVCKSITILNCKLLGTYNYSVDTGNCLTAHFTQSTNKANLIYKWSFGDATSSTSKNPSHTYNNKGIYQIKLWTRDTTSICKDSTYFGAALLCKDCKIKDSLVLDYDTANPYQAVLYNYSTGPIHKHYWDFGDGTSSTSASPTHSYSITGYICLMYIATDTIKNCSDSTMFCFTIDSVGNIKRRAFVLNIITPGQTGIQRQYINQQNIVIYPNPFNTGLLISGIAGKPELEVLDALGRKVLFSSEQEGDNYRLVFQQNTAAGLYILRIRTDGRVAVYKLYKE